MRIFGRKKNRGRDEESPPKEYPPVADDYKHADYDGVEEPEDPTEQEHEIGGEG